MTQLLADDVSCTFSMFTMPWSRRHARRLELYGKSLGLKVEHHYDGGWTLRYHLITATGHDWNVQRYSKAADRWHRLRAGHPVYTRKQVQERLAAIFKGEHRIFKETP